MKLSTKLVVSFTIVIILVGGIGLTSSYINESVKDQVTAESNKAILEVELADELGLNLYQSLTRTQYLMDNSYRQSLSMQFSRANRTEKVQISRINSSLTKFENNLDSLRIKVKSEPENFFKHSVDTSEVLSLINDLEKKFKNYASLLEQFQGIEVSENEDRRIFFTVTIEPYFRTNLMPAIEELRNKIQGTHHQQINELNSQLDWISYILIFATFIALAVAILLALYIYRSITKPISKIAEAAEKIGAGNLKQRIRYNSDDEIGQLSRVFDRMAENLSKTTVSRDYVDSIISAMANFLFVTDENFNISRINSAALNALNSSEEQLINKPVKNIFEDTPPTLFTKNNNAERNNYIGRLYQSAEKDIPVSISKGVIKNSEGNVEGYVFVASDISSQKKAQQKIAESLREKEVLLAEVHHRVKNNLAVISGLLQMQMWESDNKGAKSALQLSHLRVQSIALVHEKLYQLDSLSYIEFDQYLHELLETIADVYLSEDTDIKIQSDVKNIVLNVNQAIPSALLINELVMNAFKYSLSDQEDGVINISVQQSDDQILITVKDNGKGVQKKDRDSDFLGLDLVNTLVTQLNGRLDHKGDDGTYIEITFTAEEVSKA